MLRRIHNALTLAVLLSLAAMAVRVAPSFFDPRFEIRDPGYGIKKRRKTFQCNRFCALRHKDVFPTVKIYFFPQTAYPGYFPANR